MTRPAAPADRGTYIGLLRNAFHADRAQRPAPISACCTHRPASARAYSCICGQRWHLTQDGWIKVERTADGDRISVRQISSSSQQEA